VSQVRVRITMSVRLTLMFRDRVEFKASFRVRVPGTTREPQKILWHSAGVHKVHNTHTHTHTRTHTHTHARMRTHTHARTHAHTHTHNHLTASVRDNPGRPVPEETLTHSHPT